MNTKAGENFNQKLFRCPPQDCEVSYSWLWNVPVTKEAIDRELPEIRKAGVRSLYVLPMPKDFRPETIRTYLTPEYLTEEYFDLCEYAVRKMVELGITPWLYDEGGWPSGGAAGRTRLEYPGALTSLLRSREVTLGRGEKYKPSDRFVALFDGRVRLDEDYVAENDVTLTEYYTIYNTEAEDGAAHGFIDFTDPKVTDTFINNTYVKYKERLGDLYGDKIPLIFTDEPGLRRGTLPKGYKEEFEKTYGYDITDYVYLLGESTYLAETESEIKATIDFAEYVGNRFLLATFKRLGAWCRENGIAYAGHLMADNYPDAVRCGYFSILECLSELEIPGVDAIWEQIRYPYGGRLPYDSEETARMPFFPRIASSAARQSGRNISLTEAMGIYGDGITPDEIKYVTNYHIIRGINYISYAHIPLSGARFSALATRPDFRREKPGFYNLGHINEYFARLSYLSRLGYSDIDTALYNPIRDYPVGGDVMNDAAESFKALGMKLEAEGIPFDIIDDTVIKKGEIKDGALVVGDAVYRHIAVPSNRFMPDETKEKIKDLCNLGDPVLRFCSDKLRVMTRKTDDGRLWFIYNEGEDTVEQTFDIRGEGELYCLDCVTGEVYEVSEAKARLLCGDIAVFYSTSRVLETARQEVEYTKEITDFTPFAHKRFVITFDKLTNEYGDGNVDPAGSFSGEISYRSEYCLQNKPMKGERYMLTLEGFSVTESVKIGDLSFSLGMTPCKKIIDGAYLSEHGVIEITVANTALDEIHNKEDLMRFYPKAEIAPYVSRTKVFEERVAPLSFGKVYLSKLK